MPNAVDHSKDLTGRTDKLLRNFDPKEDSRAAFWKTLCCRHRIGGELTFQFERIWEAFDRTKKPSREHRTAKRIRTDIISRYELAILGLKEAHSIREKLLENDSLGDVGQEKKIKSELASKCRQLVAYISTIKGRNPDILPTAFFVQSNLLLVREYLSDEQFSINRKKIYSELREAQSRLTAFPPKSYKECNRLNQVFSDTTLDVVRKAYAEFGIKAWRSYRRGDIEKAADIVNSAYQDLKFLYQADPIETENTQICLDQFFLLRQFFFCSLGNWSEVKAVTQERYGKMAGESNRMMGSLFRFCAEIIDPGKGQAGQTGTSGQTLLRGYTEEEFRLPAFVVQNALVPNLILGSIVLSRLGEAYLRNKQYGEASDILKLAVMGFKNAVASKVQLKVIQNEMIACNFSCVKAFYFVNCFKEAYEELKSLLTLTPEKHHLRPAIEFAAGFMKHTEFVRDEMKSRKPKKSEPPRPPSEFDIQVAAALRTNKQLSMETLIPLSIQGVNERIEAEAHYNNVVLNTKQNPELKDHARRARTQLRRKHPSHLHSPFLA